MCSVLRDNQTPAVNGWLDNLSTSQGRDVCAKGRPPISGLLECKGSLLESCCQEDVDQQDEHIGEDHTESMLLVERCSKFTSSNYLTNQLGKTMN